MISEMTIYPIQRKRLVCDLSDDCEYSIPFNYNWNEYVDFMTKKHITEEHEEIITRAFRVEVLDD